MSPTARQSLILSATAAAVTLLVYQLVNRNSHLRRSLRGWRWVGTVGQIFIYPIKTTRGKLLETARCGPNGLEHGQMRDRQFVLLDSKSGHKVAPTDHTKLILVRATVEGGCLTLDAPGAQPLTVPLDSKGGERKIWQTTQFMQVDISPLELEKLDSTADRRIVYRLRPYNEPKIEGVDCGDETAEWFCNYLNMTGCRLIRHEAHLLNEREVRTTKRYNLTSTQRTDKPIFANHSPFMMAGEASLASLNNHSDNEQFSQRNFRPNIVISQSAEFAEDTWAAVKIGETAKFSPLWMCRRCPNTTINPETAVKSKQEEPLKTLRKFRKPKDILAEGEAQWKVPTFGVCFALDEPGEIKVGDAVYAWM